MTTKTLMLKRCISCKRDYPKTSEHFAVHDLKRGYFESRCRPCLRSYNRAYRVANVERFRAKQREWTQTPKGAYKSLKNSTRGHLVTITQEKFVEWYKSQPRICCYCGLVEEILQSVSDKYNNKTFRLTVDRMDSSKSYEENNLALCCLRCNHTKSDFFTPSEMAEIGIKYIARRWHGTNH